MVEHLGLEPSSISLQGRPADPARTPLDLPKGARPCSACTELWREGSDPHKEPGAWDRFEPTSPRLQRGAFTRLASQANSGLVRPTGIEPMSVRWRRTALPLSYG